MTPGRPFRASAIAAAVAALLFWLWRLNSWGGPDASQAFTNIAITLAPIAGGVACLAAARRSEARTKTGWFLVGLGCLSWALGQTVWTYYEELLRVDVPFPSLADVGYLGLIPFAVAGTVLFPEAPGRGASRTRTILDGLIVGLSFLFVSWATAFGPVYEASTGTLLEKSIGLAYPLGDILLLSIVFIVAGRSVASARDPFILVILGLMAFTVADTGFAYLTASETYHTGHPVDFGWFGGFLLIGLGAVRSIESPRQAPRPEGATNRVGAIMPVIPVTIALFVAMREQLVVGRLEPFLFWTGVLTILLVAARQAVTLLDNVRLTRNVEEALRQRQVLEARRVEMLNTITHDLRAPLSPVLLQVELLQRHRAGLDEKQLRGLELIGRNVRHLNLLLNDLQDVAKLDAGHLRLHFERVNLGRLVRHVTDTVLGLAEERGLSLTCTGPSDVVVNGDETRLSQVVFNLLTNALKFTPRGGNVAVNLSASGGSVVLTVADTGRGLSPDEVPRLFQPFSQVHNPKEAAERGTGLGLYISRALVERHDGHVSATSEGPGKGSTFRVELPLPRIGPETGKPLTPGPVQAVR